MKKLQPTTKNYRDGGDYNGGSGGAGVVILKMPPNSATIFNASSGTTAFPSYTFVGNTDTGLYLQSTLEISFAINGAYKGKIDSNGYITATKFIGDGRYYN